MYHSHLYSNCMQLLPFLTMILAGLTSIFWSIKMSKFSPIFYIFSPPAFQWQYRCAPPGTAFHGSHRPRWTWMAWSAVRMPPPPSRCRRSSPAPCGRWCLTTMPGRLLVDWCVGVEGAPKFGGLKLLIILIQQNWDVPTKRSCWLGGGGYSPIVHGIFRFVHRICWNPQGGRKEWALAKEQGKTIGQVDPSSDDIGMVWVRWNKDYFRISMDRQWENIFNRSRHKDIARKAWNKNPSAQNIPMNICEVGRNLSFSPWDSF